MFFIFLNIHLKNILVCQMKYDTFKLKILPVEGYKPRNHLANNC